MQPQVGDRAPDFALRDQHGAEFRLSSYAGRKAVLIVFYPFAFSGVCTGELIGFRDRLGEFETDDTTIVAISCDPIYTQRAFADRDALFFPLLSDFWPHGEVASAYGVLDDEQGCPQRSSYIVGKDGLVAWAVHNDMGDARDLDAQAERLRVSA
ncbi:MAG: peroxiredoxin [Marmoricola sp.]|nr:peroxiredoxin [Marmoricola sp.]